MENFGLVFAVIIITAIVFLLLREVNCWYWKINKSIELMEENNNLLRTLIEVSKSKENGKKNEA